MFSKVLLLLLTLSLSSMSHSNYFPRSYYRAYGLLQRLSQILFYTEGTGGAEI